MSRSWIERARRALEPSARAGLAVGRGYVGFAELAAAGGGWRVAALDEVALDAPLFSGTPTAQDAATIARSLRPFADRLRRRYLPLHVSIPDAAVRCATFELDELPKSRQAQLDLVRFRFGRQGTNGAHACAGQALARHGAKQLVFGMAVDEGWRSLVQGALAAAGMVPWSMSGNAPRQFNRFHDRLVQSSGALVALAPDAWSLWLWDNEGRPRHGRGRWREGIEDHAAIALEVERSILAYVHGGGRDVARIFVVGGTETDAMSAALDARLREPCVRLAADDGGVAGAADAGAASAALSLAAALDR